MVRMPFTLFLLVVLASCGPHSISGAPSEDGRDQGQIEQPCALQANVASCPPKVDRHSEISNPKWQAEWTEFAQQRILQDSELLSSIPNDLKRACPSLSYFNPDEKASFMTFVLFSIAVAESGLNTNARYIENSMGRDQVTGERIVSEGLFQVSYQDSLYYKCPFDWSVDQKLDPIASNKTIFNPYNQLECGLRILKKQFKQTGSFYTPDPFYWQVLKPGGRGYKIISNLIALNESCRK